LIVSTAEDTKDTKEKQRNSSRPGTNLIVSNTDGEHSSDPEIGRSEIGAAGHGRETNSSNWQFVKAKPSKDEWTQMNNTIKEPAPLNDTMKA